MDQMLVKKKPFLENGHGHEALVELWAGHSTSMGNKFSGSLRWHHKTAFTCRAQVSGGHLSLK